MTNGYRICEFCGCNTNAALRACCEAGRAADRAPPSLLIVGELGRVDCGITFIEPDGTRVWVP